MTDDEFARLASEARRLIEDEDLPIDRQPRTPDEQSLSRMD